MYAKRLPCVPAPSNVTEGRLPYELPLVTAIVVNLGGFRSLLAPTSHEMQCLYHQPYSSCSEASTNCSLPYIVRPRTSGTTQAEFSTFRKPPERHPTQAAQGLFSDTCAVPSGVPIRSEIPPALPRCLGHLFPTPMTLFLSEFYAHVKHPSASSPFSSGLPSKSCSSTSLIHLLEMDCRHTACQGIMGGLAKIRFSRSPRHVGSRGGLQMVVYMMTANAHLLTFCQFQRCRQ